MNFYFYCEEWVKYTEPNFYRKGPLFILSFIRLRNFYTFNTTHTHVHTCALIHAGVHTTFSLPFLRV